MFEQVFVLRTAVLKLEVYDANTLERTKTIDWGGPENPRDMTSSSNSRGIYVTDAVDKSIDKLTMQKLDGSSTSQIRWDVNDTPRGVSVTPSPDFHVLVTCSETRRLKEYTADGFLVRTLRLHRDLQHPLHAVKFNGKFVVAHGFDSDSMNRVCIVDVTGLARRCYGGPPGSGTGQLREPQHVAVDGEGDVIVADTRNRRVLLLDKELNYVGELISASFSNTPSSEIWFPHRIYLDEVRGRLCVADLNNYDVLVFQVRDA